MRELLPHRRLNAALCCLLLGMIAGAAGCSKRAQQPAAATASPALFTEIAAAAGIRFEHKNGQGQAANIKETTGTGCAVFDYDNDGWLDIFLVNGQSPPGDGNHLYHNNHNGTFTDVTAQAGVSGVTGDFGMGCAAGDYDGDGYVDLFVTYFGKCVLYHNQGDGTFKDVTAAAGVATPGFNTAAAFGDLDGDGNVDLYVARYCVFEPKSEQLCDAHGVMGSCPPYIYPAQSDVMFKGDGHGHFTDVTQAWGLLEKTGRGLGVTLVDYNGDNKLDLFVANDGSPNFLYQNQGHGKFKNVAAVEGISLNDTGRAVANMGCDFGDFFGDGSLACITGVFQNEPHPMWRYTPATGFLEASEQTGLRALTFNQLTFGVGFADLDNDGWSDIFLANGHVVDHINERDKGCTYAQPRTYLHNNGKGRVEDWSARGGPAVTEPYVGRGLAFGDLDNDGDIDLVADNCSGRALVIRNDHPRQNWITLRLIAKGKAWEAMGARVELEAGGRKQRGFVHTSYSFASVNDPRVHFGLGAAAAAERITIHWPDGKTSVHENLPINQIHTLVEPGATPPAPLKPLLTEKAEK